MQDTGENLVEDLKSVSYNVTLLVYAENDKTEAKHYQCKQC